MLRLEIITEWGEKVKKQERDAIYAIACKIYDAGYDSYISPLDGSRESGVKLTAEEYEMIKPYVLADYECQYKCYGSDKVIFEKGMVTVSATGINDDVYIKFPNNDKSHLLNLLYDVTLHRWEART